MESIHDAKAKWEVIGIALGIGRNDIDIIRKHSTNVNDYFREILEVWLKRIDPPPSWESLVRALRSPMVGHTKLAESIAVKHNIQLQQLPGKVYCVLVVQIISMLIIG